MTGAVQVLPQLDAAHYRRHPLHGDGAIWVEKNCYGDMWIEVLHALQLDPLASLAYTLAVDFEGDQWTFFKPPPDDLRELYGIDVQELTLWRPIVEHAIEHLGAGKLIAIEADAFWLPDSAGTDYRSQHTKTTIMLANLDAGAQRLGYFHNAGYFELSGEDFGQVLRMAAPDPATLPPFAELVRIDRLVRRDSTELAACSWRLLRKHLQRSPADNPFERFASRFAQDLPQLVAGGLPRYHAWAFASVRQAGAAFELAAAHLRWHMACGRLGLERAAECFDAIAQGNKALILKAARAVHSQRPLDAGALCADMARAWDEGMRALREATNALERTMAAAHP